MGNISQIERDRRAALATPNADDTLIEGEDFSELEPFQRPVPKVKADTPTPAGKAKIRVLPKGDGKVATGHYDKHLNAFTHHARGDYLFVHPSVAKAQEDNGLVEIVSDDAE